MKVVFVTFLHLFVPRAPVFARRSDQTAKILKVQPLPLQKPLSEPWSINGIFRLTGIKTMKGKYVEIYCVSLISLFVTLSSLSENSEVQPLAATYMDIGMGAKQKLMSCVWRR